MFSQVKPTLAKLNEDADFDVRYFASEASVGMYLKFFKVSWKSATWNCLFSHVCIF